MYAELRPTREAAGAFLKGKERDLPMMMFFDLNHLSQLRVECRL